MFIPQSPKLFKGNKLLVQTLKDILPIYFPPRVFLQVSKDQRRIAMHFQKGIGEITFKSFSESLYVRGLEFIASCIEDKVVSKSKYERVLVCTVLYKQLLTVRINLSQAAPMKAA